MANWIPIRIRTEPSKGRYVKSRIEGFPQEVMEKYYFQMLQSVTAAATDVMKNYIEWDKSVRTKTGEERAARGGNGPGRVKTGTMLGGVKWRGEKISPTKYKFEFGWIDGTPGYAIFQEQGTKNGVRAMHALQYASEFARKELGLRVSAGRGGRVTRASVWRQDVGG